MNLTPSQKGSFLAGVGLWVLIWASIWKADDVAEAMRIQRWFNSARCIRWIGQHKSTSLLGTELLNYGTHGLDPLGVSFSLGGTLVNVLFIYLFLPCLEKLLRQRGTAVTTLQYGESETTFSLAPCPFEPEWTGGVAKVTQKRKCNHAYFNWCTRNQHVFRPSSGKAVH